VGGVQRGARVPPGVASRVLLMSFEVQALVGAKQYAPSLTRGLVQSVGDTEVAAVTPYADILIKHVNAITAARMTKWRAGGLTVYPWTVNSASEWDRMTWYPGMAGVITDQPGAYLAWQRSRTC
jgi:glycerophosphoryl diester phosphodiesterase